MNPAKKIEIQQRHYHMYEGCYIYNEHADHLVNLINMNYIDVSYKLLLRKIDTLTPDEYAIIRNECGIKPDASDTPNASLFKSMANHVQYMCSIGIDLFNLIEQDVAIDIQKTKFKNAGLYTHAKS
jgi:hypothetical protein